MAAASSASLWSFHDHWLPLREPYRWARGTQTERHIGLLQHAQTGWGEVAPPPHETWDAADMAAMLHVVTKATALEALDGLPPRLRCGASTAWMDSQAQAEGVSLAAWLGQRCGRRPATRVEVNFLLTAAAPDDLRQQAADAVADGFSTLKLKVGSPGHGAAANDLERVAAVRDAAPRATLRLDANGGWSPGEARDRLAALAPYDIAYVEQPVEPIHEALLHALTGGEVPIALDESATDVATIRRLCRAGTGDAFILKPQRLGGLDRALAAMDAAGDVPVTVTNSLESAIGVTATLHAAALLPVPVACGLATSRYFLHDVAEPPAMQAGHMTVPTGPGLGVAPRTVLP